MEFFKKNSTFIEIILYGILRVFSFYAPPESFFNTGISSAIALSTAWLLWKKNPLGWVLVAGELILGGSGNYLSIGPLALRTTLLAISITIYALHNFYRRKEVWRDHRIFSLILCALYGIVLIGIGQGFLNGHSLRGLFADTVPYLFFLYYYPLTELLKNESFVRECQKLLLATIIAKTIFILGTFTVFSSGQELLHDPYYRWFRDVAGGKITDMGWDFFRVVLNEQLLLIPTLLLTLNRLIRRTPDKTLLLPAVSALCLVVMLSINLTRIYFLALGASLFLLATKEHLKRWIVVSAATLTVLFGSFTALHLLASEGRSLGWEFFGLRLQSIAQPAIEDSSLSRMLLLPKILAKIRQAPLLGNGLADTVTVFSPVEKTTITTAQFDWGYLEIIDELGIAGLLAWTALIAFLGSKLLKRRSTPVFQLFAPSLGALLIINLTSPALFHVLGVLWITGLLAIVPEKSS